MPGPEAYSYASPLEGYEGLPPLSDEKNEDGKSFVNPAAKARSTAYDRFPLPIAKEEGRSGFDVHVYFHQNNPEHVKYAHELWERIRREFPELTVYRVWDKPIGPHTVAMFEVNIWTPTQFGAFIPWLIIHRGPLSALVHTNTGDGLRDHTARASWLGTPYPLDLTILMTAEKA